MNNDFVNECNDLIERARRKIKHDSKYKNNCCVGIVGPTGATGEVGPTGPTGAPGDTPTLTIGTVTTGDPGTEATATITGTAPDFILNLTIPQGPTGPAA